MQKRKKDSRENKYDKVMRENLERPSNLLLNYFFSGEIVKVLPLVPKIRQIIPEQETDTLALLKLKGQKKFILHWEFQTGNDPRMASYDFMIHLKYELEVIGMVIYIGNAPMSISNSVNFNGNHYACKIIDIREIDPELFLSSDNPREVVLAILAGDSRQNRELIIKRILTKLHALLPGSESELQERITDLEIIGGLRSKELQQLIIKKEKKMPIIYDIRNDLRYIEGISQGEAQALLNIARKMIKKGMDIQLIHETTSLPLAQLEILQKEQL